jgi:hypothetical protein
MRGDLVPEWLEHYLLTATNPRMPVTKIWGAQA